MCVSAGGIDLARDRCACWCGPCRPVRWNKSCFAWICLGSWKRPECRSSIRRGPSKRRSTNIWRPPGWRRPGLRVPRTIVCQTPDDAMAAFAALGGDVVVKPLFGSEGRGIARLQDEALAQRAFRMLAGLGAVLYVQEFIPHDGFDIRVLVVGQKMFAMRRRNPADWRTNISRGATAEPIELTAEMAELARRAADAIAAPVAGVDLLPGSDGRLYVLEVNAVPGWKALAAALHVDIAAAVLEFVERTVAR